jgi:hypothetical protein
MQLDIFKPQKQVQKKKPQPIKEEAFDVESAWKLYQSLIRRFSGF